MTKQTKVKKVDKVNWSRIISLSAANHYITNQLNEELKKIKESTYSLGKKK